MHRGVVSIDAGEKGAERIVDDMAQYRQYEAVRLHVQPSEEESERKCADHLDGIEMDDAKYCRRDEQGPFAPLLCLEQTPHDTASEGHFLRYRTYEADGEYAKRIAHKVGELRLHDIRHFEEFGDATDSCAKRDHR